MAKPDKGWDIEFFSIFFEIANIFAIILKPKIKFYDLKKSATICWDLIEKLNIKQVVEK